MDTGIVRNMKVFEIVTNIRVTCFGALCTDRLDNGYILFISLTNLYIIAEFTKHIITAGPNEYKTESIWL